MIDLWKTLNPAAEVLRCLAFAAHEMGHSNFPAGHVRASDSALPLGMEIGLVTDDVVAAHARALAEGARELAAPSAKPWGQVVSYVRAPGRHAGGAVHADRRLTAR